MRSAFKTLACALAGIASVAALSIKCLAQEHPAALAKQLSNPIASLISVPQPISIGGRVRYWADAPEDAGPEGWGARAVITFLFPAGNH